MAEKTVEKNSGLKKAGAVALGVLAIGGGAVGLSEHNNASDAADSLALVQAQANALQAQVDSGELILASSVPAPIDPASDNMAAIQAAIEGLEGVGLDEVTGKVTLVAPPVVVPTDVELMDVFELGDYALGDDVSAIVNHNDLDRLFKGKISFNDEEYLVKELIELTSDVKVAYNGVSGADADMGALPFLMLNSKGSVKRHLKFSDVPNWEEVNENNMLELDFMGKKLSITSFDGDKMTFLAGEERVFVPNEPQTVGEKVVKVTAISNDAVYVDVDGKAAKVSVGTEKSINGLKIYAKDVLNRNSLSESMAFLVVGDDALKTVESGDGYDAEEASDANWVWDLSSSRIGVKHNKILNEADEGYAPDSTLEFADGVKLTFKLKDVDRETLKLSFDEIEVDDSDLTVVLLETGKDGLTYTLGEDTEETNKLYYDGQNFLVWDADGKAYATVSSVMLSESELELNGLLFDNVNVGVDFETEKFVSLSVGVLDISDREEDTLTQFGIIVKGVEDLEDADEIELSIPETVVKTAIQVS